MVSSKLGKDGVSDEIRRHILDATANSDVFAAVQIEKQASDAQKVQNVKHVSNIEKVENAESFDNVTQVQKAEKTLPGTRLTPTLEEGEDFINEQLHQMQINSFD